MRRATTDDLAQLLELWRAADFPLLELEKRFTEFQVVEMPDGKLGGAIGLQIFGQEGKIHSETFSDFGLTDVLRPLLWKRLEGVAQNHGLFRLWTEEPAPFWKKDVGFVEASDELLKKIPAPLGSPRHGWLMLQLKSEAASPISIEKELAMFQEASKAETEKVFQQARRLKMVATIIAALVFLFVLIGGIYLLKIKGIGMFAKPPTETR